MNTHAIPAGLIVLATALAGCLTTSSPNEALDPATGLPEAATALGALNYNGCNEHFGVLPLPMDAMGAMPEGFEPVPMGPGMVTLLAIAYECGSLGGAVDEADGVKEFIGYISVTPPAKYQTDGVVAYLVPIGAYVSSQQVMDLYTAWGYPAVSVGDISLMTVVDAMAARIGSVEGSDAGSAVEMRTVVHGMQTTGEAGMVRIFGHEDGKVTNVIEASWTASNAMADGEAVLTFSDGMLPVPTPVVGFGSHFWGEEYNFQVKLLPMGMFEEPAAEESAPAKAFVPPVSLRGIRLS